MPGLDDAGMDGAHGNLEDALAQGGAIDVALAFEGGQDLAQRKALEQGMDVGPVVVERDAPWIGMTGGFEAEPILDLALLPVDGGQLGGERWEMRLVGRNRRLEDEIAGLAWLFEDVVVVEDALGSHAIFGEHGHQTGAIDRIQMIGERPDIGPEERDGDLVMGRMRGRRLSAHQIWKLAAQLFEEIHVSTNVAGGQARRPVLPTRSPPRRRGAPVPAGARAARSRSRSRRRAGPESTCPATDTRRSGVRPRNPARAR